MHESVFCTKCRKLNPTPWRQRCPACAKKGVEIRDKRRAKLIADGLCIDCEQPSGGKHRCSACASVSYERTKMRAQEIKVEVMTAYGGAHCACCSEAEISMLALDHIGQNAAALRRNKLETTGGFRMYSRLRTLGYPPGYRVLCWNCNIAVFRSPDHTCPHKTGCFAPDYAVAVVDAQMVIPDGLAGERVAKLRKAKNMSQYKLAELTGLTQATISRLESGNVGFLQGGKLRKVAEVLGVSVAQLLRSYTARKK